MCEVCSKILLLLCRHLKFINFAFKVFRKLVESGSVSVNMKVSAPDSQNVTAGFILKDREENILVEKSLQLNKENDHLEGTICVDLESVRLWDNHNPYLYHAYVELR